MACVYHLVIWSPTCPVPLGNRVSGSLRKRESLGSTRSSAIHRSPARTQSGNSNAAGYLDWLIDSSTYCESHGNSDLVAHFFRRAFNLARERGVVGLIATNTIGQGDTRSTGLRWICKNGGTVYDARRRIKWPGEAAVVVSVVHIVKANTTSALSKDSTGGKWT